MSVAALPIGGRVSAEGKAVFRQTDEIKAWFRSMAGREFDGVFREKGAKRSLDQNAYWWAEPVPRLAEHCGYTNSQMHYALLGECFGYSAGPAGHQVPNKPSSSDLTVAEFKQLIDWVLIWAPSEMNCPVMSPEEWQKRQVS